MALCAVLPMAWWKSCICCVLCVWEKAFIIVASRSCDLCIQITNYKLQIMDGDADDEPVLSLGNCVALSRTDHHTKKWLKSS